MDFTVLHILNKWNHIVCGLFFFFFFYFFMWCNVFKAHLFCSTYLELLFNLHWIILNIHIKFLVSYNLTKYNSILSYSKIF